MTLRSAFPSADPEGKKKRKNKKHNVAMTIMLVSSMPTVISQELSFKMLFFFFFSFGY